MNNIDLCLRIKRYWREQGCEAKVDIRDCVARSPQGYEWRYSAVRSNMINGLPVGYRGELATRCSAGSA